MPFGNVETDEKWSVPVRRLCCSLACAVFRAPALKTVDLDPNTSDYLCGRGQRGSLTVLIFNKHLYSDRLLCASHWVLSKS